MGVLAIEIIGDWFGSEGSGQAIGRFVHLLAGVTWVGMLYFFDFVQVPAFAELTRGSRTEALRRVTYRAMWWFRSGATLTFLSGVWILFFQERFGSEFSSFWGTPAGAGMAFGALLGTTMFVNVWTVIWPAQKVVIASVSREAAGQDPDPRAPEATKQALRASRVNVLFSVPMLWYMLWVSHYGGRYDPVPGSTSLAIAWAVFVVVGLGLEQLALGRSEGAAESVRRFLFEDHRRTIALGFAVTVVLHIVCFEVVIGTA